MPVLTFTERRARLEASGIGHPNRKALARFFAKVVVAPSGCWEWTGSLNDDGYGGFCWNYYSTSAHRIACWWFIRRPLDDEHVDHLCRNHRCVNPVHLEPVTVSVNVLRGLSGAPRPVCARGHAMTPDNIFLQTNYGQQIRTCLTCRRLREDTRRETRRMESARVRQVG